MRTTSILGHFRLYESVRRWRNPICLIAIMILGVSCIVLSTDAQSQSDFNDFFSKFKMGVMSADTFQLQNLMADQFDFFGTTNVAPSQVFRGLSSDGGQQWRNLQSAVQARVIISQTYRGKQSQVLKCTPLSSTNDCYVVFQTDGSGHWRWKAMVMPQK